jgi:hypothetical protein
MVYCRCPVCGSLFHLNPGMPIDYWYRKFVPDLKSNDAPEIACLNCWKKLAVGDRVKLRSKPVRIDGELDAGDEGIVSAIETEAETWYIVDFDNTKCGAKFLRDELSIAKRANCPRPSLEV